MALSYLLDTSVVTRLGNSDVAARVRELDAHGLARTTITDLEGGFSARNGDEWDHLMGALDAFALVDTEERHLRRAAQIQRLLAERNMRGRRIPDLVIAAIAEAASLTVLHYDADVDHITGVSGQPTEWVVAQGSID